METRLSTAKYAIITPCACAAGGRVIGLSVSLHVCLSIDVERFEQ